MRLLGYSSFAVLTILACNGTETQNPNSPGSTLVSFGNSGCKKETLAGVSRGAQTPSWDAGVLDYGEQVEGLKCFAWQASAAGSFKISLINFEEPCGARWQGSAQLDASGALALGLVNPECSITKCGTCIYDWSFEVRGVAATVNLPVSVSVDVCPGKQAVTNTQVELPLASQPEGILCRYANFSALQWQANALGSCGTVGMPCLGTSMCSNSDGSTAQTCNDGLTCTDNGNPSEMICAKPCTLDADCGLTPVQSCQAGLCRPKAAW
jgi:hypothetical protein